ncbi:DNA cytosine methyltransferase [Sphaerisporangium dianthi]|uniref:DNA (cytosine-5-)-methyltransferase n=1 Tax=Sphaerisporangium dianthi TaxID=1436120 RepID=A0ABV9CMD3_9ACTN
MSELGAFADQGRTSVELFAGGGGLVMAVGRAGFRPLLLNELGKHACATLVANGARPYDVGEGHPPIPDLGEDPPLLRGNVAKVDFEHLHGQVDVLAGGPPCQPFSLGGNGRGDEDDRNGFPHMFRAVREMRPKAIICENVRGLLRPSFAPYFEYIKREFTLPREQRPEGSAWHEHDARLREMIDDDSGPADERYDVAHFAVNAADYGVPQTRNRVIIIAFRRDLGVDMTRFQELVRPRFSESSLYESMTDGTYWDRHPEVPRHVRETVMARIPRQSARGDTGERAPAWRTLRDAIKGIDGQKKLPPIPVDHLDRKERRLGGFVDHIGWPDARIYVGHTPNELDRPAKTVKAGVHGVPGGESVVMLDDGSHRYMSVRETARVMTFPDNWALAGSRGEKMRQLGNAVPVLLGQVFTEAVAVVLDEAEKST